MSSVPCSFTHGMLPSCGPDPLLSDASRTNKSAEAAASIADFAAVILHKAVGLTEANKASESRLRESMFGCFNRKTSAQNASSIEDAMKDIEREYSRDATNIRTRQAIKDMVDYVTELNINAYAKRSSAAIMPEAFIKLCDGNLSQKQIDEYSTICFRRELLQKDFAKNYKGPITKESIRTEQEYNSVCKKLAQGHTDNSPYLVAVMAFVAYYLYCYDYIGEKLVQIVEQRDYILPVVAAGAFLYHYLQKYPQPQ